MLTSIVPLYGKTLANVKDFYQITQDENFFDNLLTLFNSLPDDESAGIQIIFRGVNKNEEMQRRRRNLENRAIKGKRRQTDRETYLFKMYQKKQEGNLFKVKINVVANTKNNLTSVVSQIKTLNFEENTFFARNESKRNIRIRFISPDTYFSNLHWRRKHEGTYLNSIEMAFLFHPTNIHLGTLQSKQTHSIEARPVFFEQREDNVLIGTTQSPQGEERSLYFPTKNFARHVFALGKTGSGKSSLLVTLLKPLISQKGNTIFVLDPHGDLLTDTLNSFGDDKEKAQNIVYLNVQDQDRTFTINPLFAFRKTEIQKGVIRDKFLDIIKNETSESAPNSSTGAATLNRMKQVIELLFVVDATTQKPVSFKGIEYIRVGSYKKKLSNHPEKARKIWNKTSKITFENTITLKDVSDDDVLKLLDYPSYFDLMKLNLPSNKQGILGKLEEEKLIVKKNGGFYDITNLGAILFARDLNNFEFLARKAVRVVQYKGKNK